MTIYYSDKPYNPQYYQYVNPHGNVIGPHRRHDINPIIRNVQNIQQNLNDPDTATFDGNITVDGKNRTLIHWVDNTDKPILKINRDFFSGDELRKNINNFGYIIYVFIRLLSDGHYRYFYQNTLEVTNVVDKQFIQKFVSENPFLQKIIIPNRVEYQNIEFDNFIPVESNENITFMRTRLEIKENEENEGRLYNLGYLESYIEEIVSINPFLQEIIIPNRDDYQGIQFGNFNISLINDNFIYYSKNI